MDFETPTASWDPLGDPVPNVEMDALLSNAERAAPPPGTKPPSTKSWRFIVPGLGLVIFGNVLPGFLPFAPVTPDSIPGIILTFSPWILGFALFGVGLVFAHKETQARLAAVRLEKLRYAKRHGWTLGYGKRVKRFNAAFPAFMQCGGRPEIVEEWWGTWTSGERTYSVWMGELQYQVSSGKSTRTEYSPMAGVRVRSSAPAAVSLTPENFTSKFMHLFRGEYKTGNAEFDAAFNIAAGTAQQSSSAIPMVLNPPFIAAVLRCRNNRQMWVCRDRDLLLVRFVGTPLLMPATKAEADQAGGDAVLAEAGLDLGLKELLAPVIALVEEAGL